MGVIHINPRRLTIYHRYNPESIKIMISGEDYKLPKDFLLDIVYSDKPTNYDEFKTKPLNKTDPLKTCSIIMDKGWYTRLDFGIMMVYDLAIFLYKGDGFKYNVWKDADCKSAPKDLSEYMCKFYDNCNCSIHRNKYTSTETSDPYCHVVVFKPPLREYTNCDCDSDDDNF